MNKFTKTLTLVTLGTATLVGCSSGNEIKIQELSPGDSYTLLSDAATTHPESTYKRNFKGELVLKTEGTRAIYLEVENKGTGSNDFPELTIAIKGSDEYMDCMEPFATALTQGTAITQERLFQAHKSCGGSTVKLNFKPIDLGF